MLLGLNLMRTCFKATCNYYMHSHLINLLEYFTILLCVIDEIKFLTNVWKYVNTDKNIFLVVVIVTDLNFKQVKK